VELLLRGGGLRLGLGLWGGERGAGGIGIGAAVVRVGGDQVQHRDEAHIRSVEGDEPDGEDLVDFDVEDVCALVKYWCLSVMRFRGMM
jgi:hypothetical protein